MVGFLPIAVMLMLSGAPTTEAMFDLSSSFNLNFNLENFEKHLAEKKRHREALDKANVFSDEVDKYFRECVEKDLRSANAMLIRYKEDFRKVREQDDQDGRYTKTKVKKLFNQMHLYKYEPTRDYMDLAKFVWNEFHDHTESLEEKYIMVHSTIEQIKENLTYLKNLSNRLNKYHEEKKSGRTISLWDIFVYLYNVDIRLAVAKHNQEWDKYKAILEEVESQGL